MSETRFTPGPWVAKGHLVGAGNDGRVAVAVAPLDGPDASNANARLIAAAPDLYAALDTLATIMDASRGVAGYHLNGQVAEWGDFDGLIAEVRSALAKARGETP